MLFGKKKKEAAGDQKPLKGKKQRREKEKPERPQEIQTIQTIQTLGKQGQTQNQNNQNWQQEMQGEKKRKSKKEISSGPYQIPVITKKDIFRRHVIDFALFVLPIAIIVVALKGFFLVGIVPSMSMYPLMNSDSGIVGNRLAYLAHEPQRGDVIVFRKNGIFMTKRIIGIPGDRIALQNGLLYINEQPIVETYLSDTVETQPLNGINYFEVPEDGYFVMGDNRIDSNDSRGWSNPYITKKNIVAKVLCVFSVNPMSNGFYYRGISPVSMDLTYSGSPQYDPNNIVTETTGVANDIVGEGKVMEISTAGADVSYTLPVATIAPESVTAATEESIDESDSTDESDGSNENEAEGENATEIFDTEESATDSLEGQTYEETSEQ